MALRPGSASREGLPETDGGALPAWAVPSVDGQARPADPRPTAVLLRAGLGLAVALVMWLLGHRAPAVVVATVVVALALVSFAVPAVARAVERFVTLVQTVAGRALSFLLLGAVQLLVFAPLALVLRLSRHDPMALGGYPSDATFWRPSVARGRRPLYRSQFTYERAAPPTSGAGGRLPLYRLRAAIGFVVVFALLDVSVGKLWDAATSAIGSDRLSALPIPEVEAGVDEPWIAQLVDELGYVYDTRVFHPYRGWALPEYDGELVKTADGVRRSYQPAGSGSPDAIRVDFYGGSAMHGWFQRDEHTIPSEFARLAEADGIVVRPVNRGVPAYTNWQEVLLLEELVADGSVPDLAVFYDGVNDLLGQFISGPRLDPSHVNAVQTEAALREPRTGGRQALRSATGFWSETSAIARFARGARDLVTGQGPDRFFSPFPDQADRQDEKGRAAASVHARGVELAEALSEIHGFEAEFYWQPFLYSKDVLRGERPALRSFGTDPEAWRNANDTARRRLADEVVDLSAVLDAAGAPVMYDFVHTNEDGARMVARALYERLRPTLLRVAEEREG